MKIITKKEIWLVGLILALFVVAFSFYTSPCLPEKMPSHWNVRGEVDGWTSKNFALFFTPLLALAVYLLMTFLPLIDPLRKNYHKFSQAYYFLRFFLILFFALLYFYTLATGLGLDLNINFFIIPLISLLFVVFGLLLPKIKKNWFVGIRTPWTLQSDEVWQKTHQFGQKTMVGAGILTLLTIFLGDKSFGVFIVLALIGALSPVVYSYFIFRKLGLFEKKLEK